MNKNRRRDNEQSRSRDRSHRRHEADGTGSPTAVGHLAVACGDSRPVKPGGLLVDSKPEMAVSHRALTGVVILAHNSMADRVSMAVMAASMAYMFAAMQLMR